MKKVNIQHEANISAQGNLNTGNCDACIILENGMTFTSQVDLAEYLGVTPAAVSSTICGRQRTCKGYHIVSVSRLAEGMDILLTRLRETAAVEEDAKRWKAYQAEQEAIRKAEAKRLEEERKAEEKRQAEIAKATAKVARCNEVCQRLEREWNEAVRNLMQAERELEAFNDNDNSEQEAA